MKKKNEFNVLDDIREGNFDYDIPIIGDDDPTPIIEKERSVSYYGSYYYKSQLFYKAKAKYGRLLKFFLKYHKGKYVAIITPDMDIEYGESKDELLEFVNKKYGSRTLYINRIPPLPLRFVRLRRPHRVACLYSI